MELRSRFTARRTMGLLAGLAAAMVLVTLPSAALANAPVLPRSHLSYSVHPVRRHGHLYALFTAFTLQNRKANGFLDWSCTNGRLGRGQRTCPTDGYRPVTRHRRRGKITVRGLNYEIPVGYDVWLRFTQAGFVGRYIGIGLVRRHRAYTLAAVRGCLSAATDQRISCRSKKRHRGSTPPATTKYVLRAAIASGAGKITGTGISCPTICEGSYFKNTLVTLTAVPATGYNFTGWSGGCSGTSSCAIVLTQNDLVQAHFALKPETLTINRSGPGQGSVSGGGISCGGTCSVTVPYGTTLTISASWPWDIRFGAWQGPPCAGSGSCTIDVTSNITIGAPFSGYYETAGGTAHTWTNYTNAGGTEGPSLSGSQTVQIACWVTGFKVADGNTNWYRIAQSPWSNSYYVSADAFYNNGRTSGTLVGTPFIDPAVTHC